MKNSRIKAQAFDCMQFFYSAAQAPRIRACIRFDDHLSEDALKRAALLSIGAVPEMGCIFDEKRHCWEKQTFAAEDIVHIAEVASMGESDLNSYLLSSIDHSCGPQVKITLVRAEKADALCIIVNHMVCDGGGFKDYLYTLAGQYSRCEAEPSFNRAPSPMGKRYLNQLLKNLGFQEKLKIFFSGPDHEKPDPAMILPIEGDTSPLIIKAQVGREGMSALRKYAKSSHATINDVLLTAYVRALNRVTGCRKITVPCPVDLRKYQNPDQQCGICNLTGNYWCSVDFSLSPQEPFADTLLKVSDQMRAQKESSECLKGPIQFHVLFHLLPFSLVKKLFYSISPVPVTSYTNLGILDEERLRFGNHRIDEAFISTAVKKRPYFQLSVSTYQGRCTLTSSLYGTEKDQRFVDDFLSRMVQEITRSAE